MNREHKKTLSFIIALTAAMTFYAVLENKNQTESKNASENNSETQKSSLHASKKAKRQKKGKIVEGSSEAKNPSQETAERKAEKTPPEKKASFDEKSFEKGLSKIFGGTKSQIILDKTLLQSELSRLNAEGSRGVHHILKNLSSSAFDPSRDTSLRIAMVDYLVYRMKFDEHTAETVSQFIQKPLPKTAEKRNQAALLAERAELTGGLSKYRWEDVKRILTATEDPLLVNLALYESYYALVQIHSPEKTLEMIHEVSPDFVL